MKNFTKLLKPLKNHAPEILTAIGIGGMISSTIIAVKATPKAMNLISEKKEELETEKLPGGETVKTVWKCYIPSALLMTASAACIIGAQAVNARRYASLATICTLTETALSEFTDATLEVVGEDKVKEIREKAAKNKIEKNPVDNKSVIITGNGNVLCYDGLYGRYFESSIDTINKAVNEMNYQMLNCQYISLNELYESIGIGHITVGDEVGWNIGKDGLIEVTFSSIIASDGRPCVVMSYLNAPHYKFDKEG